MTNPHATPNRADAARTNGARSQGPATPEGKARSARNSLTHGLTAKSVVLSLESQPRFQALADSYLNHFQPSDPVQHALVERLVVAKWQIDRINTVRTAAIDLELDDTQSDVDKKYASIDPELHLAHAFRTLNDKSNLLANLSRYESRHTRDFDKALVLLNYRPAEPDPTPDPEPTPTPNNPAALLSVLLALAFLCLFLAPTPPNAPPPPHTPPTLSSHTTAPATQLRT